MARHFRMIHQCIYLATVIRVHKEGLTFRFPWPWQESENYIKYENTVWHYVSIPKHSTQSFGHFCLFCAIEHSVL